MAKNANGFANKMTAEKIGAQVCKKNGGTGVDVYEQNGRWFFTVLGIEETEEQAKEAAIDHMVEEAVEAGVVAPAPLTASQHVSKPAKAKSNDTAIVEFIAPEAKETKLYIITQPLGGRPRWIEKARITAFEPTEDGKGFKVRLLRKEAVARKMEGVELTVVGEQVEAVA